tara:strand:+ start:320 stop:553 length:234 start_codon:yes stop_codon:yes gene_type:complete
MILINEKGQEYILKSLIRDDIHLVIGRFYSGRGYSGLTDGVKVYGELIEYDQKYNTALIKNEKGYYCAVIPSTLNAL